MNELSLYILDLAQNSVEAHATRIRIAVAIDPDNDAITIVIEDNGCGMSEAFLRKADSPFTTTRKSRAVGLGIPLIKQLCEMCEGAFDMQSELGKGTRLTASFRLSHVDLPPMGDLAQTMIALLTASPKTIDYDFSYRYGERTFEFDTLEIRKVLKGVELNTPEVLLWIRDYLNEGMEEVVKSIAN